MSQIPTVAPGTQIYSRTYREITKVVNVVWVRDEWIIETPNGAGAADKPWWTPVKGLQTAVDKRVAACGNLVRKYLDGYKLVEDTDGTLVTRIISDINSLRYLGRTERWHDALTNWAEMLSDESSDNLWALQQGAIYTGYAAL